MCLLHNVILHVFKERGTSAPNRSCTILVGLRAMNAETNVFESTLEAQVLKLPARATQFHIASLATAQRMLIALVMEQKATRACGSRLRAVVLLVATEISCSSRADGNSDVVFVLPMVTMNMQNIKTVFDKSWQTSCS